jgi:outer membrane lipoprotein-sorting protein
MKRFTIATVAAILSVVGAVATVPAQSPVTPILDKMDRHNKSLQTLQADVAMSKYNAQLDLADPTYNGKVWYVPARERRQMYVRIDWTSPVQEQMAIANGMYRLYRPKLAQGFEGSVDRAREKNTQAAGPLSFLGMTREELRANYTVTYIGIEKVAKGSITTSRIQLVPKDQSKYKLADLWIDVDGMPVQTKVVAANGDSTTILVTNARKNATIDGKIFTIKFPAGTKVIKD